MLLQDELEEVELFSELELDEQHAGLYSERLLHDELLDKEGLEELLLEETIDGGELQETELLLLMLEWELTELESEEEELETLRKLEELLELLVDKELRLSLWLLELELWLLWLTLGELEELLWLKIDEDIELEEELAESKSDDEDEELLLLLCWLDEKLLEDEDVDSAWDMQLDEELQDIDFVEQLLLDEQHETMLSETL